MKHNPFITKLQLRNYRSLRHASVDFANPLILVGKNGSGKTNFIDALVFLAECMNRPLSSVMMKRGNVVGICSQTGYGKHATVMAIRADFRVGKRYGHYAFELDTSQQNQYKVSREQCVIASKEGSTIWFDRIGDHFRTNIPRVNPVTEAQSLTLPIIGGDKELSPIVKQLAGIQDYAIEPSRARGSHPQDSGKTLSRTGENTGSVLLQIKQRNPQDLERVKNLLSGIAPGIVDIDPLTNGTSVFIAFGQENTDGAFMGFADIGMSDGTIRALGLIAAVMQETKPSLLAVEEPEATIHPGALEAVADILYLAVQQTQLVVTTHSPELLDVKWVTPDNLRVVEWEKGATYISKLGNAPIKALQQHLAGAGELLRSNVLDAAPHQEVPETSLFDESLV